MSLQAELVHELTRSQSVICVGRRGSYVGGSTLWVVSQQGGDPVTASSNADPSDELRRLEHRFRTLIEQIPAITYTELTGDAGSLSAYISPQVTEILGFTPADFPTMDEWTEIIHEDDRERVIAAADAAEVSGEPYSIEYRAIAADGREVWLRDEARVVEDPVSDHRFWQGVMFDVTAEKRALEALEEAKSQIEYMAYHDSLTGLANRAMFEEFLDQALARARRANLSVAVLFMDIDGFKVVNDTYGHSVGDRLLEQVARHLEAATRDTDIVARQGGDEFLILASDIDPDAEEDGVASVVRLISGRIEHAMSSPVRIDGADITCGISIGSAIYPDDGEDGVTLLKHADTAMYQHKSKRATTTR